MKSENEVNKSGELIYIHNTHIYFVSSYVLLIYSHDLMNINDAVASIEHVHFTIYKIECTRTV